MQYQIFFRKFSVLVLLSLLIGKTFADSIELPELGSSSSAVISIEQERQLGQAWLRSFRSQAEIDNDYILQEYIENLIFSMLPNAGLADNRLDVLVVDNPTLNAFAVPGGVLGVHTGLLLYAQNEDQLCSVLAHELAHLSQRHFARSVQEQRSKTVSVMAGLLAGVILAATAGGDAGIALISATQAAALESQLKYSRQNEQEADRIGLEVLSKSGRDPNAMTGMFEQMLAATRYVGYQAPEYLRSHPLTENRVNDAGNRARQFDDRNYYQNPNYELYQTRIRIAAADSPQLAIRQYASAYKDDPSPANQYGLALAYQGALNMDDALIHAFDLYEEAPDNTLFAILYSDLLGTSARGDEAEVLLRQHLRYKPSSYSLNMALAESLIHQSKYDEAADVYHSQTIRRPNDVLVWYEYSETLGLAGEILELHKARAQYFMLVGAYQRAIRQLQYAKREVQGNAIELAILDQKISQAARLMSNSAF